MTIEKLELRGSSASGQWTMEKTLTDPDSSTLSDWRMADAMEEVQEKINEIIDRLNDTPTQTKAPEEDQ